MNAARTTVSCRICGDSNSTEWLYPREMMFGLRERFAYFRCGSCDSIQLGEVPADLNNYYPRDYYSYRTPQHIGIPPTTRLKIQLIYPAMTKHKLGWGSVLGRLFCIFKNGPYCPQWLGVLANPISLNSPILDVGCGSGKTLLHLRDCGFSNLRGVDPYIAEAVSYPGGVQIEKRRLDEVEGKFALIVLDHVLEHLDDPVTTLQKARQLLSEGGQILIRIPLCDSDAARKYGENWAQLDAPRHIILHSRKSMDMLSKKAQLKIVKVKYDSTEFQFWASEQIFARYPPAEQTFLWCFAARLWLFSRSNKKVCGRS